MLGEPKALPVLQMAVSGGLDVFLAYIASAGQVAIGPKIVLDEAVEVEEDVTKASIDDVDEVLEASMVEIGNEEEIVTIDVKEDEELAIDAKEDGYTVDEDGAVEVKEVL